MTVTDSGTECNDGTICENSATCTAHPLKESKYICDCNKALSFGDANNADAKFAGIYCEHQATSYCQKGSTTSEHAFCTNGGECRVMVGRNEEHAGCKCLPGYEGHYCQFIIGSKPSDWELTDFMHPALAHAYGGTQDPGTNWVGILVGVGVGFFVIASILVMSLYCGFVDIRNKLRRNEKEMDTVFQAGGTMATGDSGVVLGGRRQSQAAQNGQFVGGKSVRKKTTTGHFVTPDTLEADGGVLQDALDDQAPSMEEVDLDDDNHVNGEMA